MDTRPNPRASWASGDDNAGFYLIIVLAGLCAAAYFLWDQFHPQISAAVMDFFHAQIALIRHFSHRFDLADRQMAAADPTYVKLRDLYGIAHAVGGFVRIPATLLILVLAGLCLVRAAPQRYRRAFDLDGLIREQAGHFRTNAAFVGRHLHLVPFEDQLRVADYALTPEEWVGRFATAPDGAFDEAAARAALVLQLGPMWRGIDAASPPVRCLFAVFALHRAERRAEALQLLGALSAGVQHGKADDPAGPAAALSLSASACAAAAVALHDYVVVGAALLVTGRHAYTHPALMALLNEARLRGGVLAPGQFAWLKLVDRGLWYALHSLGFEAEDSGRYLHPNPRVEAIGARDHWAAERLAAQPIIEPEIEQAMAALRKVAAKRPVQA